MNEGSRYSLMGKSRLTCPMCKSPVFWEGNTFRPFCSNRCQLIDLQGWFGEQYRIPDDESLDAEESMGQNGDQISDSEKS